MPEILVYDPDRNTNAQAIVDCVTLGHLRKDWTTWDCTYGLGKFWDLWKPNILFGTDLHPDKGSDTIDYTAAPFEDRSWDVVVYDPPYKLCLDTATEALTRRGWLKHSEIQKGDHVYSLDHTTGEASWQKVINVLRYPIEPTKVHICEGKNLDFVATSEHRWPVISQKGSRIWKLTEELAAGDRVIKAARWKDAPTEERYSNAFVELVAWYWTEGTLDRPSTYGHITQSHIVNPKMCERISAAFQSCYGDPVDVFKRTGRTSVPAWRVRNEERNRRFIFSASIGAEFDSCAPNRVPSLDFLESLTHKQLELFIQVSMWADGTDGKGGKRLTQKNSAASEAFALACLLSGQSVSVLDHGVNGLTVTLTGSHSKPRRTGIETKEKWVEVWCPTVEGTGTWLARRNGRIYFTGNSGTPDMPDLDERYGVDGRVLWRDRMRDINKGLIEACRVARHRVLLKCQDQVHASQKVWQTIDFTETADSYGWRLVDQIFVAGYRPQPPNRRQEHARQNFSSLMVFAHENTRNWRT